MRVLRLISLGTLEEGIHEKAAIEGGMFIDKSTVEERHEFLRSILAQSGKQSGFVTHDQINSMVAHDEVELALFGRVEHTH